jgi:hypothetical protein
MKPFSVTEFVNVKALEKERARLTARLAAIENVLAAVKSVDGRGGLSKGRRGPSKAGRAKIAKAQAERWAKWRKEHPSKKKE